MEIYLQVKNEETKVNYMYTKDHMQGYHEINETGNIIELSKEIQKPFIDTKITFWWGEKHGI